MTPVISRGYVDLKDLRAQHVNLRRRPSGT